MGSDELTLQYLARHLGRDTIVKAMGHEGLVQVEKVVSANGHTHTQTYWVRPDEEEHEKPADTKTRYTIPGTRRYLDERHELHKKIVDELTKDAGRPKRKGEKPTAVLMGGGTASGKSSLRKHVIDRKLRQLGIRAATIDPDEIKERIPEFNDFKKAYPEHAAELVHKESTDIGALALEKLIKSGKSFVLDGTLRGKDRVEKLVDKLKKAGYQVHVYVADVPLEVAKARSDERAKLTGRVVPHEIIEATHRSVPKTIEGLKHKFDSYNVYDTTDGVRLFASNRYVDPERYKQFLDKGGVEYRVQPDR